MPLHIHGASKWNFTCLHVQNKLCLGARKREILYGGSAGKAAGDCSTCLAEHMVELVAAGCTAFARCIVLSLYNTNSRGLISKVFLENLSNERW